jgi:PIN domain nuclease of toxin-antitoxin system
LEPGWERIEGVLAEGLVSVVNESEVISKLIWRGQTPDQALEVVRSLPYQLVDLDKGLARRAGVLWQATKAQGLSFADRCCLALAERERLPALTTDKVWTKVSIGVKVELIR